MTNYMDYLQQVADNDVAELQKKDKEYGGSWLKRGGVGAFMMLARKWDRIEEQVKHPLPHFDTYDVLAIGIVDVDKKDSILDDIGDLRRYLMLVEAEILHQTTTQGSLISGPGTLAPGIGLTSPTAPAKQSGAGMQHPFGFDPKDDIA